jgi:hypothetical protein
MQMKRKGSFQFHLEVKISFFYFFKEQKFESQPIFVVHFHFCIFI